MFPFTPPGPRRGDRRALALAVVATACASCVSLADAQSLEWQRGAATPSGVTRSEVRQASSVEWRASTAAARQADFISPAEPEAAPARPVAEKRPAAKRPTPRRSRAEAPAPTAAFVKRPASKQRVASTAGAFASAVRNAVAESGAGTSPEAEQVQFLHGVGCGCGEPTCGFAEPGCAVVEPGCGCVEPGCGCVEPGCVIAPEVGVAGECVCGDVGCGGACVAAPGCGCGIAGCHGGCIERGAIPLTLYVPPLKELILYAGVQGFKGPLDYNPAQREGGSFGFHQGVNAGGRMSWLPWPGLGYQLGYQATQSQLSGDALVGGDSHSQQFFTAGLFHRQRVGWQYGVVYDLLQDERQGAFDFNQVRGLISHTNPGGGEVGFEFSAGTSTETIGGRAFEAADQYRLFYRHHGRTGGEFRTFIGADDDNHVILGADLFAPLNHRWSIQTGFTYFAPTDGGDGVAGGGAAASANATEEAWNLGASLVWHFGGRGKQWYRSPWRPLFDVANNGTFVVDDND